MIYTLANDNSGNADEFSPRRLFRKKIFFPISEKRTSLPLTHPPLTQFDFSEIIKCIDDVPLRSR